MKMHDLQQASQEASSEVPAEEQQQQRRSSTGESSPLENNVHGFANHNSNNNNNHSNSTNNNSNSNNRATTDNSITGTGQQAETNNESGNPNPNANPNHQSTAGSRHGSISGSISPNIRRQITSGLASIHSSHPQVDLKLNSRFMLLPMNNQIRELQTVIRDKETSRGDFKFYADRLIRLVVEEGLNQLPIEKVEVRTPTGNMFEGIRYLKGNCGVSIVRSGECMELGLRDCCRSIRIGKILIENENNQARVLHVRLPPDVATRKILLLYPIMSTGLAVVESVKVLLSHGVREDNLILLNLFSSPRAAKVINNTFPKMFVLTSDINPVCPNHFGQRYFGTD